MVRNVHSPPIGVEENDGEIDEITKAGTLLIWDGC